MATGYGRMALVVLAVFGLVSSSDALAQSLTGQEVVIPAVSFSAQGGGEVRVTSAADVLRRPAPEFVHFWCTPGHWLEWTIRGAAAGDYTVTLHYAGKFDARRSLAVNGRPVEGLGPFELPRTGRWGTWKDSELPAPVTLASGSNVLRLTCLDDKSVRLRGITLSREGSRSIEISAVDLGGQGGGRAQVLVPPTQGYIGSWSAADHWVEWAFDVPAAGRYDVHLHYSSDGYSPRELRLNGEPVEGLESFVLPLTGDERHWTLAKLPVPVTLKAGPNTLRLTVMTRGGRAVPTVDGVLGLSAIRLTNPPEPSGEDTGVMNLADVTKLQERSRRPAEITPPAPLGPPLPEMEDAVPLEEGRSFAVGRQRATIAEADTLPYVDNEFSKRYVYESYDNPGVRRMLEMCDLEEVIAPGRDEFEQQLLLMKWAYDQWDFGHGRELYMLRDPFWILEEARREHKFQCMHSSVVLQTAANSLGWVCRPMAIPRHSLNEMWSNQHRKWIQFDATSNYYPEKDGVPLNMYEHRQALLREGGGVMRGRMTDEGLTKSPQADSYGQRLLFVGYIPNTNYFDSDPHYGSDEFFITKDELCEGRGWHTRDCPADPAVDPYFPINQAALALVPAGDGVQVSIGTMTPNFKEFLVRVDGGEWRTTGSSFEWALHEGANRLEAKSVNKFGVDGPTSTVVVGVSE